jgi:hypothetical protein
MKVRTEKEVKKVNRELPESPSITLTFKEGGVRYPVGQRRNLPN